jgi:hypothetical protein
MNALLRYWSVLRSLELEEYSIELLGKQHLQWAVELVLVERYCTCVVRIDSYPQH